MSTRHLFSLLCFILIGFYLQLTAIEKADVSHTSSAIVSITLRDVNDLSPKFSSSTYQKEVSEREDEGYLVFTVSATDDDITPAFGNESIM